MPEPKHAAIPDREILLHEIERLDDIVQQSLSYPRTDSLLQSLCWRLLERRVTRDEDTAVVNGQNTTSELDALSYEELCQLAREILA